MTSPLDSLAAAVSAVAALWPGERLEGTEAQRLVALKDSLGVARRLLDAVTVEVASEISRQSRPELGADSLAKQQGFRNANTLLATDLGITNGEAAKLVQVGDAVAPRVLLTGEAAPARHPHVGAALAAGRIGSAAAAVIIGMLDRVVMRAGVERTLQAEQTLAEQAAGLSLDALAKILARAEAYLDPDGVAPREEELRAQRALRIREDRDGMIHLTATLDPEHAAPIKAAIEGIVSAELDAQRDRGGSDDPDAPRRSIPMMQADALAIICAHLIGCAHRDVPLRGATVVVRLTLDDLRTGEGHATIDGIAQPVSIATARRMAADEGVIPCVLGGDSEILDWGRQKRLFTKPQRLLITERDGGCAFCGAPPGHTRVHHVEWWRNGGRTDVSNGALLCDSCHHRIHDNGWEIRVDGRGVDACVWLTPPAHIDPTRTPRLGARRRFDYLPA